MAGDAALLVDPYGVGDIAAAMGAIADDQGLAPQLTAAGLAQVQRFSWQKTGAATAQILGDLLGR